jgi:hypothetical protein
MHQHIPLQDPQKFTQIGIFGLKICHLATLINMRAKSKNKNSCACIWFECKNYCNNVCMQLQNIIMITQPQCYAPTDTYRYLKKVGT